MYCRKCIKKKSEKINMIIKSEKQCYVCPECRGVINWMNSEENVRE